MKRFLVDTVVWLALVGLTWGCATSMNSKPEPTQQQDEEMEQMLNPNPSEPMQGEDQQDMQEMLH